MRRALDTAAAAAILLLLAGAVRGGEPASPAAPAAPAERSALEAAIDDVLGPLDIDGTLTARGDFYRVSGDEAQGPFADEGFQPYAEFNLGFRRREEYRLWRGQVSGVLSDSIYRTAESGFYVERWNLFHERGDAAVPFRAEIGDIYGYFSMRTLQRSLKGIQLEVQPDLGPDGTMHSLILLAGAASPSWRELDPDADLTSGASWLVEDEDLGRFVLSAVHNSRESDRATGAPRRGQDVLSLAGERDFQVRHQHLTLEAEVSRFSGDHDGDGGRDRTDRGLYGQLSGRDPRGISYRFRFEDYGEHYRPAGAFVASGRRSGEAHLGYRFGTGTALRGRVQLFRDAYESDNPTDTRVVGIGADGAPLPSLLPGLSARLDAFLEDAENDDGTTDRGGRTATLGLAAPVGAGWQGRLDVYHQHTDDHAGGADRTTWQAGVAADRTFEIDGCTLGVAPGVVARRVRSPGDGSTEVHPTLSLHGACGDHRLDYSFAWTRFNRRGEGEDVGTFAHELSYRYERGNDVLGLELTTEHRDPRGAENTDAWFLGVFWTHHFGKPAVRRPERGAPAARAGVVETGGPGAITGLPPGSDPAAARAWLAAVGSGPVREQDGLLVCEARLLIDIDERQRLAVEERAGRVTRTTLVVDLYGAEGPADVQRIFERVRREVLDTFGRPARFLDRGEFGPDLPEDLRRGDFVRVSEWDLEAGTLRLGIPRRLDGLIRIELALGSDFPPLEEPLWSVTGVR